MKTFQLTLWREKRACLPVTLIALLKAYLAARQLSSWKTYVSTRRSVVFPFRKELLIPSRHRLDSQIRMRFVAPLSGDLEQSRAATLITPARWSLMVK